MTQDDINKNAAMRGVVQATLVFKEIYGPENLRTFLEQELTREHVLAEIAERNRTLHAPAASPADAGIAAADAERTAQLLQLAIDALSFYADSDKYEKRGPKPTLIMVDKGDAARNALQAIEIAPRLKYTGRADG